MTVRAHPGRLSALSASHWTPIVNRFLCSDFV
jgi:hypothetical protein